MSMRILAFFLFTGIAASQTDSTAIVRVLEDQVRSWNEGDVQGYMEGYWRSEETTFVSGGTVLRGYDRVLERYKRSYATREAMGHLTFGDLSVRMLSGTTAMVAGFWRLKRRADAPGGRFTLILEKKPEGWRIVYDHTSSEP